MRKLIIMAAVVAFGAGFARQAVADYVGPGLIIIGTNIWGGGIKITGSAPGSDPGKAAMGGPEGCVIQPAIECECYPGVPVLEACVLSKVDISCLTPEQEWDAIVQKGLVVLADETHRLGGVVCSGKSDETALINLPGYE